MKIIFLRHGEAESNVNHARSSRICDEYKLTKNGEEQIRETAKSFREKFGKAPGEIFASPVLRAKMSAEIFANEIGFSRKKIVIDERIKEIDFGDFNGKHDEIKNEMDATFREQVGGNLRIRMGEYGENSYEFRVRLYRFLADIVKNFREKDIVVVISHSSPIAVMEILLKKIHEDKSGRHHTENGELKMFEIREGDYEKILAEITKLDNKLKNEKYVG